MTAATPSVRHRSWLDLFAQSAVLVAFCVVQTPRWVVPDTKLDLTVAPGALLTRAFTLWDPQAAAGQLQNQGYGYLFPMGPFFWLGEVVGLPDWVVQRLWWCVILLTAFHGMRLLLERLGVGTPVSRLVASFAFALAPRMLEGLGAVSSEIWPMALAPWVLLPLVAVADGDERRAAARSSVAFLFAGAVNAVATLALLPLPLWWLLTRRSPRRWPLFAWWAAGITAVSLWWALPLVLLGRYSPPFLDWIESSAVTTSGASTTEALRGTTQWIAAINGARGPQWPAGWQILTAAPVVGLGLALAAVGLWGVWIADRRWSLFVRGGLAGGILLVTLGRVAAGTGPLAPVFGDLLDGPLAPFRNTHKFEPVIRVVLCIGLAHAIPVATAALRRAGSRLPQVVQMVAVLAIVAQAAAPALQGVSQRGQFIAVPDYWKESANWLRDHRGPGRTLVLPGASAPASYWGDPRDEPLQPLAGSPWMVRDAVPLGSAGATRVLNDIEARVASGYGGRELANELSRLGVSRVLLRSDLNYRVTGAPSPAVVGAALKSSGATPVKAFGPPVGGSPSTALAVDGGRETTTPAITIYDLAPTSIAPTATTAAATTKVVTGGPEGVALLPDPSVPTVLASDRSSLAAAGLADAPQILTDTLQRREAGFASVRQNYGPLLARGEEYRANRRVHDWLMPFLPLGSQLAALQTVLEVVGARDVAATSSLAVPDLGQGRDLTRVPESAFDSSADTMWESAGFRPAGQQISVTWATPVAVPATMSALFDMARGADVAAVTISTDRGTVRTPISSPDVAATDAARYPVQLSAPVGTSRHLTLTIAEVRPGRPTVRIRDIGLGSLPRVETWQRLADPTASTVSDVFLQASPSRVPACVPDVQGSPVCVPDRAVIADGETDLRRIFRLPAGATFSGSGTVVPRDDAATRRLLARGDKISVRASTSWLPGAQTAPALAVDGDERTYWAADPVDKRPSLTVTFPAPREVSGVTLTTAATITGRRPTAVEVTVNRHVYARAVGEDGTVRIPTTRAAKVAVAVTASTPLVFQNGLTRTPAPVVVGDLNVLGTPFPAADQDLVAVPCGFGPRLQVNGTEYATRVQGSRSALVNGQPLDLTVCSPVRLGTGEQRLRVLASQEFGLRTFALTTSPPSTSALATSPGSSASLRTQKWSATSRELVTGATPAPSLLVVRENQNTGWAASAPSGDLAAVSVDGWAQGWVVPAGRGGAVDLSFGPQVPFRLSLLLGLVTALAAVALALARPRRGREDHVRPEVLSEVSAPVLPLVAAGAVVVVLVSGWWGLLAVVLAIALRHLPTSARTWGFVALATGWVLWSASAPWPDTGATNRGLASQLLAAALLAVVVLPRPLSRQRSPGSQAR
ncbi:hypothetical protein ASD62_00530 [Phycicoccus sp. Root563]|uniref:alpha-(1->3)-arabinofuranosyltransferase domain-containing protein n=1 Tax=Phycicoccus sp. Root563 TaxID=1736562 RepID=UPI0007035DED|nr:alpha-(1->3)-arabinofuranosyltransferase family protein [Phycicoccus sp. Root563]KQZ88030.1 hypothetical protein ASD62_00530 [Phycicoccus sp. Root563]